MNTGKDVDLVCFGEPLAEFAEVRRGTETLMLPGLGGDTMNVAAAAARQGARVAVFTALGDDPFAARFRNFWDAEGIDHKAVRHIPGGRTGIYFITYGRDGHVFSYVRDGSAASRVSPADVPEALLARTKILHVSGISQAISDSACDATFHAMRTARAAGALISYDTNLRLKLWPLDRARAIILAAVAMADIARPGLDDARQLIGLDDPDAIADHFLGLGPSIVAMTLGAQGSLIATRDWRVVVPGISVDCIDASGAGDCFGGAFLAEYLRCGDPFTAARYGNVAAALKTLGHGAVASIPRRDLVEARLLEEQR